MLSHHLKILYNWQICGHIASTARDTLAVLSNVIESFSRSTLAGKKSLSVFSSIFISCIQRSTSGDKIIHGHPSVQYRTGCAQDSNRYYYITLSSTVSCPHAMRSELFHVWYLSLALHAIMYSELLFTFSRLPAKHVIKEATDASGWRHGEAGCGCS